MSNIRHPGAARRVITVGAVDKAKVLAPFSSTGPGAARLSPGSAIRWTKPDRAGPGVNIVSSVLGGGFAAFSGTSMATARGPRGCARSAEVPRRDADDGEEVAGGHQRAPYVRAQPGPATGS